MFHTHNSPVVYSPISQLCAYYCLQSNLQIWCSALLDDETPHVHHLTPDFTYYKGFYQKLLTLLCQLFIITEYKITITVTQFLSFQLLRAVLVVPCLSQNRGTLKLIRLSCPSVTKTLTWVISSKVLMIEHWYLACMILVTSPFYLYHVVILTLTFFLLQGQICCREGTTILQICLFYINIFFNTDIFNPCRRFDIIEPLQKTLPACNHLHTTCHLLTRLNVEASVTILADFGPEFNPPFRWCSKLQTKNHSANH